jgi:hypothetical protein
MSRGPTLAASDVQTGEPVYQGRIAATGRYDASPLAANGHIYFTSLESGAVTVVKAGTARPIVAAQNPELASAARPRPRSPTTLSTFAPPCTSLRSPKRIDSQQYEAGPHFVPTGPRG